MSTFVAVDWSGARDHAEAAIWLAEVREGRPVRLENGRRREEVTDELLRIAERDPEVVVGLDFAFGFPAWFSQSLGAARGPELWAIVAREGERWLSTCPNPFWGRPGRRRPELEAHFRKSELGVSSVGGITPKSVFQIGGAGAVGTGSLRGMPELLRLREAGFSIWPFDPPDRPVALEIYPRLLTGPVVKSDPTARAAWVDRHYPELPERMRDVMTASEDAFDAAASAMSMWSCRDRLATLRIVDDPVVRLEGAIWEPFPRE